MSACATCYNESVANMRLLLPEYLYSTLRARVKVSLPAAKTCRKNLPQKPAAKQGSPSDAYPGGCFVLRLRLLAAAVLTMLARRCPLADTAAGGFRSFAAHGSTGECQATAYWRAGRELIKHKGCYVGPGDGAAGGSG